MPKKSSSFTEEQLNRILSLPKEAIEDMLIKTLLSTAGRISEVVGKNGFTPSDINYEEKSITLLNLKFKRYKLVCSKCKNTMKLKMSFCPYCSSKEIVKEPIERIRTKEIDVDEQFLSELKQYILNTKIQNKSPVFPISRFTAYRMVRKICESVGIKTMGRRETTDKTREFFHGHPHNFRHSFATLSLKRGMPLTDIKDQLGHSTLAIVGEYISPDAEQRKRKTDIIKSFTYSQKKNNEGEPNETTN